MTKRERDAVWDASTDAFESLWPRRMQLREGGAWTVTHVSLALAMTAYALSTQHGRRRLR